MKRYKKSDEEFGKLIRALAPKSRAKKVFRVRHGKKPQKLFELLTSSVVRAYSDSETQKARRFRNRHMQYYNGALYYQTWLVNESLWIIWTRYNKEWKAWKRMTKI
jgi:hypothetical protein